MLELYFEFCTDLISMSHSIRNSSILFIEYFSCSIGSTLLSQQNNSAFVIIYDGYYEGKINETEIILLSTLITQMSFLF